MGIVLYIVKSERNVASGRRHVGSSEEPVPNAEGQTIVDAFNPFGKVLGVVPDVHLRRVEEILQGADRQHDIGVVEMSDGGSKHPNGKEINKIDSDQGQRNKLQHAVDDVFAKMEAEVGSKAHLFDAVVDLMKLPERRRGMQKTMDVPLREVTYDKDDRQQ